MEFKSNKKKQLAAAVTLAVMGTAWVAVPGQVWAADGGSQDHPRQYSSYTADSDRAIAIAREQKTGEDMYAAQYHENFADLAFRAKDDMGGKTITLKSMTVEGIIGADGKGAAAGLPVEESTAGKNGGIGSAVGIYSTNILNANITFGDIAIKAIGGNTYSQEITSGKYTHEGKVGVDGASDKNLNGGAGANGGNGGRAIAVGVDITGRNNTVTGGVLTVTATGSDGGHGGYGGVGGTAAAITTVPAKAGDGAQGADGADSTTSGTTPSTAGANGTIGGAGGAGLAGAGGTAGTVGAIGLTGGIGGNGSNGGSGSNAEATGLKIAGSGTATTISLGGLVVEAAAGNGGAGGAGGAGGIGGVGGTGGIGGNGGDGGDGGDGAQGGQGAQGAGGSNAHHSTGAGDNDVQGTVGGNGGNGGQGGAAGIGGNGGIGGVGGIGGQGGTGGTGGHGGNGGVGGNATALGFAGTDSIINLAVAGNGIAVTATGGDGAKAGIGGAGGNGGFGGNGGVGGDGGDYGDAGKGGHGGAGGAGGQGGILLNGNIAVQGSPGVQGGEGDAAVNGTVGTGGNAGQGGTGGTGGNAGNAGISQVGGSATSTALTFTQSQVNLQTTAIKATATAGKGVGSFESSEAYKAAGGTVNVNNTGTAGSAGTNAVGQNGAVNTTSNGGAGGSGITPTGTIVQTGNGEKAIAAGLVTINGTLNVVSDAGLEISAEAKDASVTNTATAVKADGSKNVYAITGDMTVKAAATGDVDLTTATAGTNPKFVYEANKTNTTAAATAFAVNGGSMLIDTTGAFTVTAQAGKGETRDAAQGMELDNTTVKVHAAGAINIKAEATGATNDANKIAHGIEGDFNDLEFVSDAGGIKVTAIGGTATSGFGKEYSVWTYDSTVTFDAKDADEGIELNGDVAIVESDGETATQSILNLKSDTKVQATTSMGGNSKGALNITGTTMNLTDNLATLTVADKTTLAGSNVYFYDENNQADKYNTADYRTITTKDMTATGTNELFMRTNANGVYGQSAGNDKIVSTNTATGGGIYDITVFDQGMRNGYNNAAGAADKGHLLDDVKLIENADASGTYNIQEMQYDNGVWSYEYTGKAKVVDGSLNLTEITTKAAVQSSAQKAAQDANKIAAGAAVTLFGADETLMERLGDVRNSADDNDGVWAKYVGGKIKVDGIDGDNDFKYNGFAAGYDREVGNNWRIGLAGQYAKGDTTLTGGDGEIKAAAGALYGTWTGDKGHHVDIIAKVGKVDSETSAYGGTIAQKLDGDFGSTAMSFAVEYGYRQQLNDGWFIEPMARASYVRLGSDDYTVTTRDGSMSVTNDTMNSIVLRGGFLVGKTFAESSNVYLKAAILHDFDGDINTSVRGDGRSASYSDSIGGTAIEYGIGVNHKFNKDSSMYFDVERASGGDVTKNWGVNVGFRYSF